MKRMLDWINDLYPFWLVGLAVIAFCWPHTMLWFSGPWIFWALALSMLGMGLTLSLDDFRRVASMPGCVVLGFGAQYALMPLAGWLARFRCSPKGWSTSSINRPESSTDLLQQSTSQLETPRWSCPVRMPRSGTS